MRSLPRKARLSKDGSRFRVHEFANASGTTSWRVVGWTRDGKRLRENYADKATANARRTELENVWLRGHASEAARVTTLDAPWLRQCELAVALLGPDAEPPELFRAVKHWVDHARNVAGPVDSPRLDDAAKAFTDWLPTSGLRDETKRGAFFTLRRFNRDVGNPKLGEITPEFLEAFFAKLTIAPVSKDNLRRALSQFFSWCLAKPRRWMNSNPCLVVNVLPENGEHRPPPIYSVSECEALLRAAERTDEGRTVPYIAIGLFAGLRPQETSRLTWAQINFADGEIRLEGVQSKMKKPRVIEMCPALKVWLAKYKHHPIKCSAHFLHKARKAGGIKTWPHDILRHTSATAHLREFGSYAETARQFGNSESVLKEHYEGRMSSTDAARFYKLRPTKEAKKVKAEVAA